MAPLAFLVALSLVGCSKSDGASGSAAPPASASGATAASAPPHGSAAPPAAHIAEGVPLPPAQVERIVNPKHEAAYSGPTGTVAGLVTITGDASPDRPERIAAVPADCLEARETYAPLFREGLMRAVADVFVAVTEYQGYVPASQDQLLVEARGCAFDARTIGLTYGQGLDIVSKDRRPYVPELLGARTTTAQLVVTPGGKPIRLYPEKPGRYVLVDSMRTFAAADVLVVAYSTFDVTRLDGKFEIKNVPVGKVKLNALLPQVMLTSEREITVEAGKTTTADLELKFDLKAFEAAEKKSDSELAAKAAPKGSASASP